MNVLIIGSGGREHAIAWKVAQSPRVNKLYIAPGNPGTVSVGENVDLNISDHPVVIQLCKKKNIDLVIVGSEVPLAEGMADSLVEAGIRCFGPKQAAAQIEASKSFSKDFMQRHNIPTAKYAKFVDYEDAVNYLSSMVNDPSSIVIKASGLAAGKGVILPESMEEAKSTLEAILVKKKFGAAGAEVVIEERLVGEEVSLMAFTDGTTVVPMLPAQDHKRLLDGDHGPNTGGMGAYAPAPVCTAEMIADITATILQPAVTGLKLEGTPFVGVLYAGLILTSSGVHTLEFNCRFGDPETQAVLPLLETDLVDIALACVDGTLKDVDIRWKDGAAVCVVLAGKGYPEKVENGKVVKIEALPKNVVCFHAGTKSENGNIITSGGRVFGLTAWAENIKSAIDLIYANVSKISYEGMQYRRDIGHRVLKGSK
ncbi:MAG: phosphoribosylamine--glycine ligase [Anaerolineales bacterium]|nr:phosphoribosylamine--glycine ligase [Anaerolineales bacterium]